MKSLIQSLIFVALLTPAWAQTPDSTAPSGQQSPVPAPVEPSGPALPDPCQGESEQSGSSVPSCPV